MALRRQDPRRQARRFGWILAAILAALASLAAFRGHPLRAVATASGAVAVVLLDLFAFPLWLRVFHLWMKLADALGFVMTRVILAAFFFLLLTPVGWFMRLVRRDPLHTAWHDGRPSYWVDHPPVEPKLDGYERQF